MIYRDDTAGVHIRRAGEPCDHRHGVHYTDAGAPGGHYSRCQLCGAENAIPDPIPADLEPLQEPPAQTGPADPPVRRGRNDCETCGAPYRAYFGQWWRTQWGSKWFCSTECAQRHT